MKKCIARQFVNILRRNKASKHGNKYKKDKHNGNIELRQKPKLIF